MPHENNLLFMLGWMVLLISKVALCVACLRQKPSRQEFKIKFTKLRFKSFVHQFFKDSIKIG